MTSEAELAGRNSGLDMVASNLMVFGMLGHAMGHISTQLKDNGVIYKDADRFSWHSKKEESHRVRSIDIILSQFMLDGFSVHNSYQSSPTDRTLQRRPIQ